MDLKTKVFITDPFKVNLVKMFSEKINTCKDLLVEK